MLLFLLFSRRSFTVDVIYILFVLISDVIVCIGDLLVFSVSNNYFVVGLYTNAFVEFHHISTLLSIYFNPIFR